MRLPIATWKCGTRAAVVLLTVGLGGCTRELQMPPGPGLEKPTSGGTFVMAQDPPEQLDPACVDDVYEATLVNQIFEGLLAFDGHLNVVPSVASSWMISPEGTVYTFHLKKGIRFHDGSVLTADDVVFSLQRVFDLPEDHTSLARTYLSNILGAEEYARGVAKTVAGLEALSPGVVRITLRDPYASFLAVLASEMSRIVPRDYVRAVGDEEFSLHPVGCGPFRMTRRQPGRLVLERFPHYFASVTQLDSLVFELPAENARDYSIRRFLEGRLSAALVPDGRLNEFRQRPDVQLFTRQELSLSFIGLNDRIPPFTDVRVRRAFAQAIDRDAIVRSEGSGRIHPNGVLPPGMPGYTPEPKVLPYDLAQARALLAAAGYPNGQGLPPIVHTASNQSEQARQLVAEIRSQVSRVGFELRSETLSWREFSERLTNKTLQCFTVTWVADVPDPDSFLQPLFHSSGSANFEAYVNSHVDALLARGRVTRSSLERLAVYREAEKIILDEAPVVPLYHPLSALACQMNVRGFQLTPMGSGNLALERVWFASPGAGPRVAQLGRPLSPGFSGAGSGPSPRSAP